MLRLAEIVFRTDKRSISANVPLLGNVADNVNELMKTKFNITSVFSAEKLNGNSAKQLL